MSDNINCLEGKTITEFSEHGDEVVIKTSDGNTYKMLHFQDCCEHVWLEDICGDVDDILNSPVVQAIEYSEENEDSRQDLSEWTFYKIDTTKGGITMRWCGESSGYYSVEVSFIEV